MKRPQHIYSETIYDFLLNFYPKEYRKEFGEEMKYVFSQSLKDVGSNNGDLGIVFFWIKTFIDLIRSITTEQLDKMKGGEIMKTKNKDIFMQNKIFLWIAGATILILSIPAIMMRYGAGGWDWKFSDFLIMGVLLFGMGSLFIFTARKIKTNRLIIGIGFLALLVYIWAELAVGIFTNLGN
ncbi:MAG TPA: hypothetical protein VHE53_04260 [Patescibacteria group bacterium]|nr:hypothetical protein [Patescibacteria group bacterium]